MIRCAAIGYVFDQDEPSKPFVFDLPDAPTKEQIESAMVEEMRSMFEEELLNDIVVRSSSWGDLEATESENDLYLIVSFPPEHRDYLRGVCQLGD